MRWETVGALVVGAVFGSVVTGQLAVAQSTCSGISPAQQASIDAKNAQQDGDILTVKDEADALQERLDSVYPAVGGDLRLSGAGQRLVLRTPDGTACYALLLAAAGNITTESTPCP